METSTPTPSVIVNSSFVGLNNRDGGRGTIGGLIGETYSDGEIVIRKSFSKGDMYTTDAILGGLVGYNSKKLTIEDSYALGNLYWACPSIS